MRTVLVLFVALAGCGGATSVQAQALPQTTLACEEWLYSYVTGYTTCEAWSVNGEPCGDNAGDPCCYDKNVNQFCRGSLHCISNSCAAQ